MDRRGRGRGGGTPYGLGMPFGRIPPHMPIRTTDDIRGTQRPVEGVDEQPKMDDAQASSNRPQPGSYNATVEDVKHIKVLLTTNGLPWEIVHIIMDMAEYWACSQASVNYGYLGMRVKRLSGGNDAEDSFMLRCPPVGLTKWPLPAPDSQEYKEWWTSAARPKHVADYGQTSNPTINNGESNEREADLTASTAPLTRQLDFDKETLEKFTDIPVPTLENPVRKIVFDIVSSDQGHGGHEDGTRAGAPYDNSHTWFDAGLDRFDRSIPYPAGIKEDNTTNQIHPCMIRPIWPISTCTDSEIGQNINRRQSNEEPVIYHRYHHALHPDRKHVIQFNKRAVRQLQHHHVEWSWLDGSVDEDEDMGFAGHAPGGNGEFVRSLRLGDMVTIWGRARYGGWSNNISKIEVKVYYAA